MTGSTFRLLRAFLVLCVLGTTPSLAAEDVPRANETHSRYIESFDGTRLAVTVYQPTGSGVRPADGRYPVIVTQDRGEAGDRARARQYFLDNGYVVVAQDRRGTGASFGVQTGFVTPEDLEDAKAVIEWSARAAFSTGAVGTMGCSNQGVWQYGVAALKPAGLKAIAPACASPAFFDDAVTLNGVPMFRLRASFYDARCAPTAESTPGPMPGTPTRVDTDADGSLLRQALGERGCTAPMLGQYWLNMPRDGWNAFALTRPAMAGSPIERWQDIAASGVAILQLGGWFDAAIAGQFAGHRLWGGRVVMGPWVHGNRLPQGSSFSSGEPTVDAEMLAWFDRHLKGQQVSAPASGVRYYVVNARPGTEWRSAPTWQAAKRGQTPFYLVDGELSRQPPAQDRTKPVGGEGVRWFDGRYAPLARWWSGDMAAADAASLVHTSAPLSADTEMIGTPVARLWIASPQRDLNLYAVLEDVAPDGKSTYVTDGRIRASWRSLETPRWGGPGNWHPGWSQRLAPLEANTPTELVFDLFPIAYNFRAGHRIRIALTTSIGEDYQQPPRAGPLIPTATLLSSSQHRSVVELPLAGEP